MREASAGVTCATYKMAAKPALSAPSKASPRSWTATEWRRVIARLKEKHVVDATDIVLSATDVQRLVAAAPRKDGRPHFAKAIFHKATFGVRTEFRWATFGDGADFTEATFADGIGFFDVIFEGGVNFTVATFRGKANFSGTTFGGEAKFYNANFEKEAYFRETTFCGKADFSRATFEEHADFYAATFDDVAHFSNAQLRGANFEGATFGEGSRFSAATFHDGATFAGATLQGADFYDARLEGVNFGGAHLGGIRLTGASFDYRASLEGAWLFVTMLEDGFLKRAPHLGDVRWNGIQVTGVADWMLAKGTGLGEDPDRRWPTSPATWIGSRFGTWVKRRAAWAGSTRFGKWAGQTRIATWAERATVRTIRILRPSVTGLSVKTETPKSGMADLAAAVRAYRQVSTLLAEQGLREVAREFDYRASQLARRQRRMGIVRFLLWALDSSTGYGHRPARVLVTYAVTVLAFAVIYGFTGVTGRGLAGWIQAIPFSLIAFHGRGVINANMHFQPESPLLWIPALEASFGLLIEALAVAVIVRRLFGS